MNRFIASAGALTLLILGSGVPAYAQDALQPLAEPETTAAVAATTEERLTLRAGDVFEMIADPGVNDATYSWILTQERTFIEAGRERLFRYRFVQEQNYTLRAEVVLPTGERRQRSFVIDILPQGDASISPVYPAGTGASLAGTVPAPDTNGRVVLTPAEHVLQLSPMRTDLSPLALDLNAARDTDGDGNPENDVDDTDTYFHSFGRSLWIWFARPLTQTDLIVTAVPPGSSPLVQRITVLSEEVASSQGVLTSSVIVLVEQMDDDTFGFVPQFPRPIPGDSPLLYEWEFGDGTRSLETNPVHQFTTTGDFIVKLHVRDLSTGETVGRSEATVSPVVLVEEPIDEPEPTPVDEPEPTPVEEPSNEDGLPWGRILLIVGIFVGSLAIGIAIVWLLAFLRKSRSLEQTLESMEKVVAPSKEQAPPPLAIKSKPQSPPAQAQQKVIDAEINAASPSPVSAPVSEAAAPSWLKKGLAADQSAQPAAASTPAAPSAPKTAPVPPPAPKPQAPATRPTPPATKVPATPAATPAAPVMPKAPPAPKPQAVAPQAPISVPKPAPAPQAPKPAPVPVQPRAVVPPTIATVPSVDDPPVDEAPDPAKLPRWLQPATPATTTTSASTPSIPTPANVTPPKPASSPMMPPAPKPQATPATPPTPKPQPVPPPKPGPTPAQPTPVNPIAQPKPAPIAPVMPSAPAPTQTPTPPPAPASVPPMPAPVPITPRTAVPAPMIRPTTPPPAAPQQVTPPPAAPATPTPSAQKNDDDRPIAIIRADSLDPEPPK